MENERKKKNPKAIIGVIIGLAIALSAQFFIFKKPDLDKEMMKAAAELNKTCPVMMDQDTRFDNAVVLPGNVFQYNYTLVNISSGDLDVAATQSQIEPNLVNTVKTNPDLKIYRDNGTTLNYNYNDKDGKFLFKVSVTPEKYK